MSHIESKALEEEGFRFSFDGPLDAFAILSPVRNKRGKIKDFRIEYISQVGLTIGQSKKHDLAGHGISSLLPKDRVNSHIKMFIHVFEHKEIVVQDFSTYSDLGTGTQQRIWLNVRVSPLDNALAVVWRNITEQKHAEERLKEANKQKAEILESIRDGFFTLDYNWEFTYVNEKAAANLGLCPEDMVGRNIWEMFPQALGTPYEIYYRVAMQDRIVQHFEQHELLSNRWYDVRIYPSSEGLSIYLLDIQERKQDQEELIRLNKELQKKISEFETLFNALPVSVLMTTDATCEHIYANPTMETLLEIPPGSNMSHDAPNGGKPDYEIYQNGRMLTSQEMPIQKAVISGRSVQGSEYDIVKYDGKTVNLRGHAVPLFDDQGNVRGAIGAFDDITEHKDMEKRLREMAQLAEKRASELDAVMASIPDGLIIHDREQNLVYLNEYAQCIFQYTEEMLTWSIDERLAISKLYTADSQNVRREDTPMFKALRGEVVDDCELIFKSGIYGDRWASSKSAPIYDGDGAITGTVTTFIDITERKRAEAALRESEEKYRQIVETASEGIIISEPDGTIVFTNLRMADMLGYPREELIGRNGLDLLESGQQEIVDGSRSDLKEGITIRQEYKWLRPDGTCLWTYASISPIKDQMGVHKVNLAMHTDVTERKQVENELRVSEERFRAVLENSLDAAYRRNLQTDTYDYMSPVIKQILGYTPDEMNEMSMDDVLKRIHPDDRQNITDQMEKANEVGYGLFEYRFRTSKGDYRWLADHVKIIKDIYGKPLYRGGILRDITDRKRMEKDLIANRQLLENVINSTPALVLARDMEGRLILLNDALAKRYGVPKEMALGTTLFDFYPTEVAEAIRERDLIVLGEDTIQQFEESVSHNGVPTNYMTTKFPLHDAQGNVYGLGAVITDITERKRVELELERRRKSAEILSEVASMLLSSDHLQEIVEKLCIKVMDFLDGHVFFNYLIDEEKQRLHLNAFAGISQEQAHGIEWLDFGEAVCGTVARDGCRIICENIQSSSDQKYELVRSKGLRAYVCHPLIDKDRVIGTLSFGTRTYDAFSDDDISMMRAVADQVAVAMSRIKIQMAIKESEERYRSIAEELSEVNRRKDEFLAVLSHELRNPLAAVRNSFYLLERSASGSQQALRAGEVIERQVKLLTHLVDDLLDITRINQNKIKLQRQTFDLNEVVQQTLDDHRMLFEKHELFLELQPSPAVVMVNADKARLSQVLGNLLINASKFTGRGGRVRVVVETNDVDGQGVIRVIDNGVGISPELLPNLFQPFVQADTSLERGRGGLGLGLALSKGLIEMHGGSISAYSEGLEMGSEFVIRIPLQEMGPIETALGVDEPLEHRSKVLIIEDNADLAEMLAELLRLRGYQAEYALNGLQGIDKAREFLPEVILCDIGLPRMNGYEVARALRSDERLKDVFLVALSGYALPDDLQKASEAGFEQHLAKPVDLSTLERTLTKIRKVENLESVQH